MHIRRRTGFLASLAALSLTATACGGIASDAGTGQGATVKLRATNLLPPGGSLSEPIQWFMDELERRTSGKVETEVVYGGALVPGTDTFAGLQQGRAEAGHLVPAYFPAELPLNNINMVPIPGADQSARAMALQDLNDQVDAFAEEFEDNDLVLVGYLSGTASTVAFKEPVSSLHDIKGSKIRIPSQPQSKVWEKLGAEPVFMPSEEVYEATERGIVDGVTYPMDTQVENGVAEVATHMLPDVGNGNGSAFVFSKSAYDELPESARAIFNDLKSEWYTKANEFRTRAETDACTQFLSSGGTVTLWNKEDGATIAAATEDIAYSVWQNEATKSADQAVVDEVWNKYKESLERHTVDTGNTHGLVACAERE